MSKLLTKSLCVVVAAGISGCASIAATFTERGDEAISGSKVYAGTRTDLFLIEAAGIHSASKTDTFLLRFACVIDLPLSLVADTLFLPYTLTTINTGTECSNVQDCTNETNKNNKPNKTLEPTP